MTVASCCTAALLVAALISGCRNWSGFGFDASGPEMPRLKEALALHAGMVVADVGAGKGQLTRALAATVGPGGHVFSTEIDPDRLTALRAMLADAHLGHVTVVEAKSRDSGLPAGCCDAIVLRRVYHHLTDPAETNASLLRALRPGGLLAVIDMPPPFFSGRGRLGVPAQSVVKQRVERLEQHHRRLKGFLMGAGVPTAGSRAGAGLRRRVNRPPTHVPFHKQEACRTRSFHYPKNPLIPQGEFP